METLSVIGTTQILNKPITVFGSFENPLFLAMDVAEWIEHTNVSVMINSVDDCEVTKQSLGSQQGVCNFLTEDGLYEVLMQSRKPIAKEFKKQVKAYLKELRTKGITATPDRLEQLINDPDTMIKMLTQLKTERQQRQLAESKAMLLEEVTLQQAPKVQYFDQCLQSQQLISTTELANELGFSSALALNKFLKEQKILRRVNNNWALSADYSGVGLAAYKTHPYKTSTGADATNHLLCWTEKGRLFLRQFSKVKSTESI